MEDRAIHVGQGKDGVGCDALWRVVGSHVLDFKAENIGQGRLLPLSALVIEQAGHVGRHQAQTVTYSSANRGRRVIGQRYRVRYHQYLVVCQFAPLHSCVIHNFEWNVRLEQQAIHPFEGLLEAVRIEQMRRKGMQQRGIANGFCFGLEFLHSADVVKGLRQFFCAGGIEIHCAQVEHQRRGQVGYAVNQERLRSTNGVMASVVSDGVADVAPDSPVVEVGLGQAVL